MGGNFVYIFLRMMRKEWKSKFVRTAFFMAVPWVRCRFEILFDLASVYEDEGAHVLAISNNRILHCLGRQCEIFVQLSL